MSHLHFSITSHLYVKWEEYLIMFQSNTLSSTFCSDGIFCISVVLYVTTGYLWLLNIWTVTSVWRTKLFYYILVNLNLNSSRYLVTTILDCTTLDQSIQIFLSFCFFFFLKVLVLYCDKKWNQHCLFPMGKWKITCEPLPIKLYRSIVAIIHPLQ